MSSNTSIKVNNYSVCSGQNGIKRLQNLSVKYDRVFVIADENTSKYAKILLKKTSLKGKVFVIKSGEKHKQLATCEYLWKRLLEEGASRYSLLINVGGGVVCDLGGFVASCYMRGIDFVNVPTTVLAMVDAAVGGKTGVDFLSYKNTVGVFSDPQLVLIWFDPLVSLSKRQTLSGFAEMIKHGLVLDRKYFDALFNNKIKLPDLIWKSIQMKRDVVLKDKSDKGLRKLLNFGHTAGHALETLMLRINNSKLLHGEAVAWGMVVELYLSHLYKGLSKEELDLSVSSLQRMYKLNSDKFSFDDLYHCMKSDKKNSYNKVNFTLISAIGKGTINNTCSKTEIKKAVSYANECFAKA